VKFRVRRPDAEKWSRPIEASKSPLAAGCFAERDIEGNAAKYYDGEGGWLQVDDGKRVIDVLVLMRLEPLYRAVKVGKGR
jgi:hypothetical protein